MRSLTTVIRSGALVVALLAAPTAAAAADEPLVPPGNSAVNQYTETFPTAGGDKDFQEGGKRSPGKILGSRQAKQLEEQGEDGRAAAEVAAETAPAPTPPDSAAPEETDGVGGSGGHDGRGTPGGSTGDYAGGGAVAKEPEADGGGAAIDVEGSSGFGEVLAQATGASDTGEMGLLLPLAIFAALVWAATFLLRRHRRVEP